MASVSSPTSATIFRCVPKRSARQKQNDGVKKWDEHLFTVRTFGLPPNL